MAVKLTPIKHGNEDSKDGFIAVGAAICLGVAIGVPQLGWSPFLYAVSAFLFAAFLKENR